MYWVAGIGLRSRIEAGILRIACHHQTGSRKSQPYFRAI